MATLIPFNRRRNDLGLPSLSIFNNMLDDFFTDGWPSVRSLACDSFRVDVREDEKGYIIEAELPGVKKDEISISLDEDKLSITVSRDESNADEVKNYLHRERRHCSMQRNVYLAEADSEGITAKLDAGELTVNVPKKKKIDTTVKIEIE